MLFVPLLIGAGLLPTFSLALPVPFTLSDIVERITHSHSIEERESASSYTVFGGNGETADGWPSVSDWISDFDTMFAAQNEVMSASCTQFGVPNNSDEEISEISSAIQSVGSSTGVDPRFILAIVMQESNGCVRAPTTNYGVRNPGLMQSHNGAGTCNDGSVSNPCPSSEITQMIQDGVAGTSSGDGLKQLLAQAGTTDASMYYKAARLYNSGSIAAGGNLGQGIATHCYVSDIANRLIGWSTGLSQCSAGTIGSLTSSGSFVPGSSGSSGSSGSPSSAAPSTPSATSGAGSPAQSSAAAAPTVSGGAFIQGSSTAVVAQPTATPAVSSAPPAATTVAAASSPSSPSGPEYGNFPGATAGCQQYHTVQSGDDCDSVDQTYGISLTQLTSWNSGLDSSCSNLWLGYNYCVKS